MKHLLTVAFAAGLFANASAQNGPDVKVVRAVRTVSTNTESNMQIIMDKLQTETENTAVYPLVRMTQAAMAKVQHLKRHAKRERIRSNNNPKRVVNPNRA